MFDLQLKRLRTEKGLNQTELGKLVNTSQRMVSCWETGRCELPISVAYDLAEIFDCSLDELAGRKPRANVVMRNDFVLDTFLSQLNPDGVAMVEEYARVLAASGFYSKKQRFEGLA